MAEKLKTTVDDEIASAVRKIARYSTMPQAVLVRQAVLRWLRRYKAPDGLLTDDEAKAIHGHEDRQG